jgi:thioredoxin-like negative regulator of GroEL
LSKVTMYHATWCSPCQALKPVFKQVSTGYLTELGVEFVLVDVEEAPTVAAAAGVRSVPTIIATVDGVDHWITSRQSASMSLEIERLLNLENG